MRRRTGVFLLLLGTALLVGGAWALVVGSASTRGVALLGVLPFGLSATAIGLTPFLTRSSGGMRLEHVRGRRSGPAVVFPFSAVKQRLTVLGGFSFACLSLSLVLFPDAFDATWRSSTAIVVAGLCGTVVFLAFAIIGLPAALGLIPSGVSLLPQGIEVRGHGVGGFTTWENVESLNEVEIQGSRILEVRPVDPDRVESSATGRFLRALNRNMGFGEGVAIAAQPLEAELDTVAAAIEHVLQHPEHRERLGTPESLVDLGLADSR